MSALPQAAHTPSPWWSTIEFPWTETAARAPVMVATMAAYLDQLGVSARHTTVAAAEQQLRHFAGQVTEADPECTSMAAVERRHIEAHKLWLAARPGKAGKPLAAVTIGNRLGTLRTFFERLRDWDYDDAPSRTLIFPGDFPQADEPLPKFLDDPTMEKFKVALANDPNPRRRLMVEILTQTGIRAGELAGLQDDAVTTLGDSISLRIPVGKLHNDRYVPLLPRWSSSLPAIRSCAARADRDSCSSATTVSPSTGAPSIATSIGWPSEPASVTSIPTSSATPWPPSSSTRA
jgi:site-specific recombinase XerC